MYSHGLVLDQCEEHWETCYKLNLRLLPSASERTDLQINKKFYAIFVPPSSLLSRFTIERGGLTLHNKTSNLINLQAVDCRSASLYPSRWNSYLTAVWLLCYGFVWAIFPKTRAGSQISGGLCTTQR